MLSRPHVLSVVSEPLHLGDSCHVHSPHLLLIFYHFIIFTWNSLYLLFLFSRLFGSKICCLEFYSD